MNTDTASGRARRTLAPPCTSTSSTTTCPALTPSSTKRVGVAYRWPCTSAHSRKAPPARRSPPPPRRSPARPSPPRAALPSPFRVSFDVLHLLAQALHFFLHHDR